MLKALSKHLRNARQRAGLSLEAVAGPAKISAAYLHKLERGAVDSPSPRVLARVAAALDVSYLELMSLAGYLDEAQLAAAQARAPRPHPLAGQQLTPEEWRDVAGFIQQLVARRGKVP